ncbi:unnamed protein product [Lupinus luteus]|uniref:Transmembrane protein n=1 Tax=Lupinus luteus TaxID=3873 RepID=A0AAV1WC13_LUPLU
MSPRTLRWILAPKRFERVLESRKNGYLLIFLWGHSKFLSISLSALVFVSMICGGVILVDCVSLYPLI